MDVAVYSYSPGDPVLIDKIVNEFLSQGKFDKLRKECMADADTKPAYQNLQQRVETTVSQFLKKQMWKPDLNKNQLRDSLRKHIMESGFLDAGINRIVDQIVNPNILATVFMPEVEEVVYSYLSIPKPADRSQKQSDTSNKVLTNGKNRSQLIEDSTSAALDSEKDYYKGNEKNDEFQCGGYRDKIKTESSSDIGSEKASVLESNSGVHLDNGASGDVECEIKTEAEQAVADSDGSNSAGDEVKPDVKDIAHEDGSDSINKLFVEKLELPSDESQESLSKMGIERLRIIESDGLNAPDSDASVPLEINEKSMSDSRDSDDSIMNKMSPISQGRLTPDDVCPAEEEKEEKRPLTFIGRIPKIKRDDSESSKSFKKEETPKRERLDVKSIYSSDESDSSKHSFGKSDSEDKRSRDRKAESKSDAPPKSSEKYDKSDRKYRDGEDRRRRSDHHKNSSSERKSHSKDGKSRDDKSRSKRDEKDKGHSSSRDGKRDRSRDRNSSTGDRKNSSSSSSRNKGSSHRRSVHKSISRDKEHHRDDSKSRERDRSRHDRKEKDKRSFDKRKREEEKRKKSKNVDDHGRERNRRDDRRSTDRDSNERERDRTKDAGSERVQSDGRKRDMDQKVDDTKKEKNSGEESDKKEDKHFADESHGDSVDKNWNDSLTVVADRLCISDVHVTASDGPFPKDLTGTGAGAVKNGRAVDLGVEKSERSDHSNINQFSTKEELVRVSAGTVNSDGLADHSTDGCDSVKPPPDSPANSSSSAVRGTVVDFGSLHEEGVLTEVSFPEVLDDFYVKFDSTGFRYFEDWETTKLDCEEEFKEYIDEAENDLSLLSDDGSDYEGSQDHLRNELHQQEILTNSLNGFGNFESGLMFDPSSCRFYRWTKAKYYRSCLKNNSSAKNRWSKGGNKLRDGEGMPDGDNSKSGSGAERGEPNPGPDVRAAFASVALTPVEPHRAVQEEEEEMSCIAEKNKENQGRSKRIRKNLKFLNRYRRKIGLTFKHGKEQHRFVRRSKKHFAERSGMKPGKGASRTGKEPFIGYANRAEMADRNGMKGTNLSGSHDLREWNSIGDGRGKTAEPLGNATRDDANILSETVFISAQESPLRLKLSARAAERSDSPGEHRGGTNPGVDRGFSDDAEMMFNEESDAVSAAGKRYDSDDRSSDSDISKSSRDFDPVKITPKMDVEAKIRLHQIQSIRRMQSASYPQKTVILARLSSADKSEEENLGGAAVEDERRKAKKRGIRIGLPKPRPKMDGLDVKGMELTKKISHNFNMPLSPESDDSTLNNNGLIIQRRDIGRKQKRMPGDGFAPDGPPKKLKDCRRSTSQKYESQDLYKPRPFSLGSKTRGRAIRMEGDDGFSKIDSGRN